LAVSWAPECADRAGASLARVVRAFTALRGMAPTAEAAGPTCRVVRFAGAGSPHPALVTSPDGQVTVAAAGWCFAAEAADAADEGGGLLRATARQVRAAWPAWVADLTSGLDSRLVVAALAEPGAPVHVTVNGPDDHLDVAIARLIADRFGWSLEHVSLPPDWGERRRALFEDGVALADGELGGHAIDGTLYAKRRLASRFAASL